MTIATMREQLIEYVKVADDKKIKGLYFLFEDVIQEKRTSTMAERYPCNVPKEQYDYWQKHRLTNDADILCKKIGLSRPVIDRALNYGHVKKDDLADKINKFFEQRVEKQKKMGQRLLNKATD